MMGPGDLNRRLTLQEPAEAPDGAGGVARSYATVTTLWANVEPVSARNSIVADADGATVTHRITIRRRAGITTRHRFAEGDTIYRIVSLRDDATRRFLVIGAEVRED
jgi:SPP1 family predicted phage head-tail adaptor